MFSAIAAHWHGEISLSGSFWGNGVVLSILLMVAGGACSVMLLTWTFVDRMESPTTLFFCSLGLAAAFLVVSTWQIVGIWRSAGFAIEDGRYFWPWAARLMMFVFAGLVVLRMTLTLEPLANLGLFAAYESLHRYHVWTEGDTVHVEGLIMPGTADEAVPALENPHVRRLFISGQGGMYWAAKRIETVVHRRRLTVIAGRTCLSACTMILATAYRRAVLPETQLGFHRLQVIGDVHAVELMRDVVDAQNQDERDLYRWAGADETFIAKATGPQTDEEFYAPGLAELVSQGIVTDIAVGGSLIGARQWCRQNPHRCAPRELDVSVES